jgi:TolB protein
MISDAIYQALTGIPGDFSGRIAYVLRNPATPAERYTLQIADTDGEQPKLLSSRDPIFLQHGHLTLKNCLCFF